MEAISNLFRWLASGILGLIMLAAAVLTIVVALAIFTHLAARYGIGWVAVGLLVTLYLGWFIEKRNMI